ncbi:MAG: hypothetical protein ACLQOO_28370 [Terriglobia bacterium]
MASPLYLTILSGQVQATPVAKPLMDAFTDAEVTVSATGKSGFQLSFTLANSSPLQLFFLLAMGAPILLIRVILVVSFGGLPQVIMDGMVKHTEVVPDAMQGSSKLVITGEDLSAVMDLTDSSGTPYPGLTPDLRVLAILGKYATFGIVPNVFPVVTPDADSPSVRIPSQKGTDLAYVQQLAKEAGYVFFMQPGPTPGSCQAYWGPLIKIGVPQPALNVNMDTWTNVETLNFRYEPQNAVAPIIYLQDPTTGAVTQVAVSGANPLNPPLGSVVPVPQKTVPLPYTAKLTPAQALMAGYAKAAETADIVTVDGTISVLRYGGILQARQLVGVRGAGVAFDGLYYVDSTKHQIKLGEYKQSFTLKRNALVSNVPVVPTAPF